MSPGASGARRPRRPPRPGSGPWSRSRIELHRGPAVALAGIDRAVMEAEGLVLPELDAQRLYPEARPMGRTRHGAEAEFRREFGDSGFQGIAVLQRPGLVGCPGADLAAPWPAGEIGIGFGGGGPLGLGLH